MPCINNAETVGILSYFIEFLNLPYTKNGGLWLFHQILKGRFQ